MADKPTAPGAPPVAPAATVATAAAPAPRRGPGHRADMRDTVLEMTEKAQVISKEAGTKVAAAMKDVISAGAGITGFAIESARDLVQFMVRRGQMTADEADKLIHEAEAAHMKRPAAERARPTASKIAAERAAQAKVEAAARLAAQAAMPFRPPVRPAAPAPVKAPVKSAPAKPEKPTAKPEKAATKAEKPASKSATPSAKSAPPAAKSAKPAAHAKPTKPAKAAAKKKK